MKANGFESGIYVIGFSVILGGIHWIWSIVDVVNAPDMRPYQKRFWLIVVVAAPAIGSMFYYAMHQRPGKIVT